MYDYVIVGAGLFGATFAQQAKEHKLNVLVIDKRDSVAGNCATELIHGINVHKFGPHIFHTKNKRVWEYVNRFTKFNNFSYRPRVNYQGKFFSFPINLLTLHQLWNVKTPAEAVDRLKKEIVNTARSNFEECALSQIGRELYETFFYGYTKKQWGREPRELPSSIFKRIPVRLTFNDRYYEDDYEGIPVCGYSSMVKHMLDGVEVQLGVDFFKDKATLRRLCKHKIVYTGPLDEYFGYCLGQLAYRSLHFEHETYVGDFQGVAGVNYTHLCVPFTRIVEHKHFDMVDSEHSVVTKEFPEEWSLGKERYYPIADKVNARLKQEYVGLAKKEQTTLFGGRLGTYTYMNMDAVIASALCFVDEEMKR